MNSNPPAVATEPPMLYAPVSLNPRASSDSTRPKGIRQATSPVFTLIAKSSPHGGDWHGQPVAGLVDVPRVLANVKRLAWQDRRRLSAWRFPGSLRNHPRDFATVVRIDEEVTEFGIEAAASPIEAAIRSGKHHRIGHAHGSKRTVILRVLEKFLAVLSMLRREPGNLIALPRHSGKRRRLQRKRLRGRIPLSRHVAFRNRTLFHAINRFAVAAVEDKDQPCLARLDQRRDLLAVMNDIDERRLRRQIGIPEIVMHGLEIPLHLAGRGIHRDQRIAEQIRARTIAPIAIIAGRAESSSAEFRFACLGEGAPDVHSRAVFPAPAVRAIVEPSLMADFARLRNGVESPYQLSGGRIPGAHVPLAAQSAVVLHVGARNDQVLVDNRECRSVRTLRSGGCPSCPCLSSSSPSLAKPGTGLPVFALRAIRNPSSVPKNSVGGLFLLPGQ